MRWAPLFILLLLLTPIATNNLCVCIKDDAVIDLAVKGRITINPTLKIGLSPAPPDGESEYFLVVVASLIYKNLKNVTTGISNKTWKVIAKRLTGFEYYKIGIYYELISIGVDIDTATGNVRGFYPVTESILESKLEEELANLDEDDRLMFFWIGHGIIDDQSNIGALALYSTEVGGDGAIRGEYVDPVELTQLLRAFGKALDFAWIMACNSTAIMFSEVEYDGEKYLPIMAVAEAGAVAYTYKYEIIWHALSREKALDKQIQKFEEFVRPRSEGGYNLSIEYIPESMRAAGDVPQTNHLEMYDFYVGRKNISISYEALIYAQPGVTRGEYLYWFGKKGFVDFSSLEKSEDSSSEDLSYRPNGIPLIIGACEGTGTVLYWTWECIY